MKNLESEFKNTTWHNLEAPKQEKPKPKYFDYLEREKEKAAKEKDTKK